MSGGLDPAYLNTAILVAAAISVFFTTRGRAKNDATASAIVALQAEISTLKDDNHRLEVKLIEYKGRVEILEQHNQQLSDLVAARPEWQLLMQMVKKQSDTGAKIDSLLTSMPTDWQVRQDRHYEQTDKLVEKLAS